MAKFQMGVVLRPYAVLDTVRLGGASGATPMTQNDQGKFVKYVGDSRYDMCAAGDKIEGVAVTVGDLNATFDGYVLGSIQRDGRVVALADGSQAAGTGSIAVGDYVVCGTVVAKGTSLGTAYPKVRKATNQPGVAPVAADNTVGNVNAAIAAAVDAAEVGKGWRVMAILSGSGAVGDKVLIERV